jgi:hypothetical protein
MSPQTPDSTLDSEPDFAKMLRGRENFTLCQKFATDSEHWRVNFSNTSGSILLFTDLILVEHTLRRSLQRADCLEKRMIALQDVTCTRGERKQLKSYGKELRKLTQAIEVQDRALYEKQATLAVPYLKPTHAFLTQNPAWYLRKELTDDCIARGGCCSRQCGCCEDRHLHPRWTRGRGIGHCTAECGCCAIYRGYDYTNKEREEAVSQFKEC